MPDQNMRFLLPQYAIRGQIVKLDKAFQDVLSIAHYPKPVAMLLGQALAAVSALGSIIKMQGSIIMQVQGDGRLQTLVAQANHKGEIRGLAQGEILDAGHDETLDGLDFTQMLGKGRLVMTVDAKGGKRYQGITGIQGEQLSDSLSAYFTQSEQLATHIHLFANDGQACCFFLQQLPQNLSDTDKQETPGQREQPELQAEQQAENWQHIQTLSQTLSDDELLSLNPEEILHRLFHQETVRIFEPEPLIFNCQCSRERLSPVILQMGLEEALQLTEQSGEIRADCEFCNQSYHFNKQNIIDLFNVEMENKATRH